ncbi:guanine deaminase [Luminiphilus syltensis NOR5-1B]|uniref:Guanine deaminase n=1 Tax=Luminiphilus syltensis NOR5-1B TaxID=565045 RepID=B8KWS2_9GAMM|nr:nucleoside deaminase [Luminiphilus syltensis]EED34973.1 guanine deaminase [Luminiphilus syltensis NOR5-1B]
MQITFLHRAIQLASDNIDSGKGGPFGAVIVKNNEMIAESANRVLAHSDPTAHAEVEAIRSAGEALGTFDLSGCTLYASCEPCPMCLGAIYWARISAVYFAGDRKDAESAGFDDKLIYDEIALPVEQRRLSMIKVSGTDVGTVFQRWREKGDRQLY